MTVIRLYGQISSNMPSDALGSKADGFKLVETKSDVLGPAGGNKPRPIRKRGYHRALKRKEPWAMYDAVILSLVNDTLRDLYRSQLENSVYEIPKFAGLSAWIPNTNPIDFWGLDRSTVPLRYVTVKGSLWQRIKSWISF